MEGQCEPGAVLGDGNRSVPEHSLRRLWTTHRRLRPGCRCVRRQDRIHIDVTKSHAVPDYEYQMGYPIEQVLELTKREENPLRRRRAGLP